MKFRVLTIAGSDSGGGAGIQADLKTFSAFKTFGMSAITSITAQNTTGVSVIYDLPADIVSKQIDAVISDIGVDAIKIGMLSNVDIIDVVAKKIREYDIEKVILDPVMRAKGGDALLKTEAQTALIEKMLPLAYLITPNIPEAEVLIGLPIKTSADQIQAAKDIFKMGPKNVFIKGGHGDSENCLDILFDGNKVHEFNSKRINTKNTHGTGCTISSAIAACIAKGDDVVSAVAKSKEYINGAIKNSLDIGKGHGPLNHFWNL
jgi:hydroxymethylpyrimidine/phosphomethylpyrimidine kinase